LRLYNSKYAPNARRVRIFLAEKGLTIPFVELDLAKLDQKSAEFSAVNPFQTVPALELDNGDILCESIAICRYLEELHPEPDLFGREPRERAEIEMWQRRLELYLFYPILQAYRHSHPAAKVLETPQQLPEWGEINRARALEAMARIDAVLASRRFIAGDRFSVADITGLCALDFGRPARIAAPPEVSHLQRWRQEISARPSASA
jgi:glutathione S-transferase